MSWSFYAIGKPAAVSAKAAADLSGFKCNEPEESVKAAVISIIGTALASFPDGYAVRIEAGGSQNGSGPENVTNAVSLKIEPLMGFVE